jgi:hypothetical protein
MTARPRHRCSSGIDPEHVKLINPRLDVTEQLISPSFERIPEGT